MMLKMFKALTKGKQYYAGLTGEILCLGVARFKKFVRLIHDYITLYSLCGHLMSMATIRLSQEHKIISNVSYP